jgi:hypothetical protein
VSDRGDRNPCDFCHTWHTPDSSLKLVKILVESGAAVDAKDINSGAEPLFWACASGRLSLAKFLISKGANINCVTEQGLTPLHVCMGGKEMAEFLIKQGIDVNVRDRIGKTPLHTLVTGLKDNIDLKDQELVFKNLSEAMKVLLENGADINAKDINGATPLQYCCNEKMAEFIKKNGGKIGVVKSEIEEEKIEEVEIKLGEIKEESKTIVSDPMAQTLAPREDQADKLWRHQ